MKIKDWLKDKEDAFSDTDLRYLIKEAKISEKLPLELDRIFCQYQKGVPLAYLLGKEEFFGHEFFINRNVLIPRKETEVVVEAAIEAIRKNHYLSILDLCCGSGNIAVTIKKECEDIEFFVAAADKSLEALAVAQENIKRYNLDIPCFLSDLFSAFFGKKFDMIISNPPYVESDLILGSLKYEPRISLDGGKDGLESLSLIIFQAYNYLNLEGKLVLEFGCNHKDRVEEIVLSTGKYSIEQWIKDYGGHWRGVILIKSPMPNK